MSRVTLPARADIGFAAMEVLLEGGAFFEGPRWHEGRWWVSDFYRRTVSTVDEDGREDVVLEVPGQPSGTGWMPDGSLLVVSRKDMRILRRSPGGEVTEHADLSGLSSFHLNDMVVDAQGRAYVGNFGFDLMARAEPAPAELIRIDPDGRAEVAADGLMFPNGTVITPDGATLIVGETFGERYTAFTIREDGSLSDRRVWAELEGYAPDGCALDAEGHIWSADGVGGRAGRIAPGGEIVQEVHAPDGLGVFACMLGGEDGRTLLLCAAPDFYEQRRQDRREAVLLTTTVDVPHAGLP
jgi:sugar lactone lactonase YvrE